MKEDPQEEMRVKEWVDGALTLDGKILEGAEAAFKEERYVEAFALIQALIDWWMTNLCQRHQEWAMMREDVRKYVKEGGEEIYFKRKYRFPYNRRYLLDNGIINQQESNRLTDFYESRNKIIHRLLIHSFQTNDPRTRVTKIEAVDGFKKGTSLVRLLETRTLINFESGQSAAEGRGPVHSMHYGRVKVSKVPPAGER